MKKIMFIIMCATVIGLTSCTENQRAKTWGGDASIDLPPNQKLVVVTWKDNDLWYLTREMRADEKPETYIFNEESSWGVWEGSYKIMEHKK